MPDLNTLPSSPVNLPIRSRTDTSSSMPSHTASNPETNNNGDSHASITNLTPSSTTHSLAAAATLNSSLQTEAQRSANGAFGSTTDVPTNGIPSAARRRSSIRTNLELNDPGLPAPGEMAMSPAGLERLRSGVESPSHHRAPSLGELHQEMEEETEAQVNRLLTMIRSQQAQLTALQTQATGGTEASAAVQEDTPTSEVSTGISQLPRPAMATATAGSAASVPRSRSPFLPPTSLSRHSSFQRTSPSPMMRPTSGSFASPSADGSDFRLPSVPPSPSAQHMSRSSSSAAAGGSNLYPAVTRDEGALYQAETQMLTRENQMLKNRIRELERQLGDSNVAGTSASGDGSAGGGPGGGGAPLTATVSSGLGISGERTGHEPTTGSTLREETSIDEVEGV